MAPHLMHGGQPQRGHLLVVRHLHAELLVVLGAHRLVLEQHAAGPRRPSCRVTQFSFTILVIY